MRDSNIYNGEMPLNDETPITALTVGQLRQALTPSKKRYWTIRAMSENFDVSKVTIYNWIKTGKVNPVRIGGRTYFDADQITEDFNSGAIGKYKHKA